MPSIVKFKGNRGYAKISNTLLQNSKLSFKARGLMAYILSLPDTWELCAEHLYNCCEEDGRTSVQSAMRELRDLGYLSVETIRNVSNGQISDRQYIAYDDPSDNQSYTQQTLKTENPTLGERAAIKEIEDIKEIEKKENNTPLPPKGGDSSLEIVFPDAINTIHFINAWNEWLAYRAERKLPKLQHRSIKKQLDKCAKWGVSASIDSINESISNGWQGLFEPKNKSSEENSDYVPVCPLIK